MCRALQYSGGWGCQGMTPLQPVLYLQAPCVPSVAVPTIQLPPLACIISVYAHDDHWVKLYSRMYDNKKHRKYQDHWVKLIENV